MDAEFTAAVSQLYHGPGSQIERQAATPRCGVTVMSQKKRARLLAVLLALVALAVYFGFMWMTANGYL